MVQPASVPLCQFYLKGNCRYGDKCFNSHQGSTGSNSAVPKGTFQEFENQVKIEMSVWENSGMWLLSSLGPLKDHPPFPGFKDWSPEEIRLEAYQDTTFREKLAEKFQHQKQLREALKNRTPDAVEVLKSVFFQSAQSQSLPFSNASTDSSFGDNSSIFGGTAPPQPNQSIFGNNATPQSSVFSQSTFNSNANTNPPGTIFGGQSTTFPAATPQVSSSIFGNAASAQTSNTFPVTATTQQPNPIFNNMPGQQASAQPGGIFGGVNATNTFNQTNTGQPAVASSEGNIFGQNNQPQLGGFNSGSTAPSIFGGNSGNQGVPATNVQPSPFANSAQSQSSIFGGNPPAFSQAVPQNVAPLASCSDKIYTPLSNLSEADRIEFEKEVFTRIPLRPPPKELCV